MPTLLDYLRDGCGETFAVRPFCEADNLALAQVSYLELAGAVPALGKGTVSVREAWQRYVQLHDKDYIYGLTGVGTPLAPFVLQAMAKSERFRDVLLGGFARRESAEEHEQFAAIFAQLPDGTTYVAFRGTDSSLAGWREDLMLSYQVVAAQRHALGYLRRVASECEGTLMVGGHSKGGNLAGFASAFAPDDVRARISDVWCNDSPGFDPKVVDFDKLRGIAPRVHLFVPQYCVVGALMEHVVEPVVVTSGDAGILQHGMTGWELDGKGSLVRAEGIGSDAQRISALFDQLLKRRDLAEREAFVTDVFDALYAAGATSFDELAELGPAGVESVITHLQNADKDTRATTRNLLLALAGEMVDSSVSPALGKVPGVSAGRGFSDGPISVDDMERHRARKRRARDRTAPIRLVQSVLASGLLRNYAALGCGLLVLANAGSTAPVVAHLLVVAVAAYSAFLLGRFFLAAFRGQDCDAEDFLVGIITAVPAIAVLFFSVAVMAVYNLLIGGGLLAWGIHLLRRRHMRSGHDLAVALRSVGTWNALVSIAFGLLLFANPTNLTHWLLVVAGVYIVAQGVWGLVSRG